MLFSFAIEYVHSFILADVVCLSWLCGAGRNIQVRLPPWTGEVDFGLRSQVHFDSSFILHPYAHGLFFQGAQMKNRILLYNTVI